MHMLVAHNRVLRKKFEYGRKPSPHQLHTDNNFGETQIQ